MHSTTLNWQRVLMGLSFGPFAAALAVFSGERTPGIALALVGLGFALFAAAVAPVWLRARDQASQQGVERGRRSFGDMPTHLKIPLGINIAMTVLVAGLALLAAAASLFTDVPVGLVVVLSVLAAGLTGVTYLLWRIGSRPTGARQQLEGELKENSDTRRQLVALGFASPLLLLWLFGSAIVDDDPSVGILVGVGAVGAAIGVVSQWVDARETRRVIERRDQ